MKGFRFPAARLLAPGVALTAVLAAPAPARGADCIRSYANCLVRAAEYVTWWERTAAGLDCYLDAVACVRGAYF